MFFLFPTYKRKTYHRSFSPKRKTMLDSSRRALSKKSNLSR